MQQIQIIGNLGEDCQVREFNGQKFVTFRVACTEKYTDHGERKDLTTWYSCSMNRAESGVVPYLLKGTKVYVQGLPSYTLYDSATFHCKMIDVRIFVDKIQLCGEKRPEPAENQENDAPPF